MKKNGILLKNIKLTKMLNDLSKISGHGTELVTVYIPPRRPIYDIYITT